MNEPIVLVDSNNAYFSSLNKEKYIFDNNEEGFVSL